jgi:hypothetical protein
MWTCGIDMATQQLRPAMINRVWSAAGDIPRGRTDGEPAGDVVVVVPASGDRRRKVSASGSMVTTQKPAIPR